jgi:hypothetical protein
MALLPAPFSAIGISRPMNRNPSRYGGIIAVLVLGIGMVAVGKTAFGFALLGLVVLILVLAFLVPPQIKVVFITIAALIGCGVLAWRGVTNEISGTATYYGFFGRGSSPTELVTRAADPGKFRAATNFIWLGSGLLFYVAVSSLISSRRLDPNA